MKNEQTVVLEDLRGRLIARAVVCSTALQDAVAKMRYHDAHEHMIRREIFLTAADMVEQEIEKALYPSNSGGKVF